MCECVMLCACCVDVVTLCLHGWVALLSLLKKVA